MVDVCVRFVGLSICVSVSALWELVVYCGLMSGRDMCALVQQKRIGKQAANSSGTIVDMGWIYREKRRHASIGNTQEMGM